MNSVIEELSKKPIPGSPVSAEQVRTWMASSDWDTLGATYAFLSSEAHVQRVKPGLSFDEVFRFMLRYYELCLATDPKSQWANSRYSAGWDLASWFVALWDERHDKRYFDEVKSLLASIYRAGTPAVKKCIEHAILEHLFERKAIRRYFIDWRGDPALRAAYDEAALWVAGGGSSPLTESNK